MFRLTEVLPFDYKIIERRGETKKSGVLMTLEGTIQRADTKNANGRVYPTPLWQKIIDNEDVQERIKTRRMLGELDHPSSGATSLSRVSHIVTEQNMLPDGRIFGKLDILDTPSGKIAATMFEAGVQLGISSRGDGSVEKKGDTEEVQDDFRLETYDLVLKPSTPGAFPTIAESEESSIKNHELIAQAVEGLVKDTDDVGVLLECHKIISVLNDCNSRCESVLSEIKGKLGENKLSKPKMEENMTIADMPTTLDSPPGINLSPEMKNFLDGWVNERVAKIVGEKDAEISGLNDRIVKLTATNEGLNKKMAAAESIIEEFDRKVKELSENANTDTETKVRYDAAVKLLDEAVNKLKEFGVTKRRLAAAESLLSVSITRHKTEAIEKYIDDRLDALDINESMRRKYAGLLERCSTTNEVDSMISKVGSIVEAENKPRIKEPLPTRRTTITEDKARVPAPQRDFVTQRLLAKISG